MIDIETAAKAIYSKLPADKEGDPNRYPWVDGGNSHMQELARDIARAVFQSQVSNLHSNQTEVSNKQIDFYSDLIQVTTLISNKLMHEPSMFERNAVCKYVQSLGRNPELAKHFFK